eukprot:4913193-Pyramimonas_sp.AAC.1
MTVTITVIIAITITTLRPFPARGSAGGEACLEAFSALQRGREQQRRRGARAPRWRRPQRKMIPVGQ